MGIIAATVTASWTLLVLANWWPAFGFPLRESISTFTLAGFPFDARNILSGMRGHLWRGLFALLALLAVRGWGALLPRFLRSNRGTLLRLCLGLAIFSGLVLGLGLAGLLQAPVMWTVLVAGIILGGIPPPIKIFPDSFPRLARLAVVMAFLPALFAALAPEVTYDALAYHLGAPEQWLKVGRIVRLEHMFFSDFPLILQMVYLAVLGTGGDAGSAKLIHFILGILCVAATARLGEKAGGRTAGAWGGVFMAGAGLVTTQMGKANVDLGVVLATVVGLTVLLESRRPSAIFSAGLCFGVAAGIKLTGGIGAVAVLLLLARSGPASWAVFSAGVMIPLLAWLARTGLETGNPVYPFLFGGLGWSPLNAAAYRFDMTGPTSFNVQYPDLFARLAGPWLTFMHDRGSEAALGIFTLVLAPLAVARRRIIPPSARSLGVFAAIYWLVWFAVARDSRFFLPALPACAILSACVLASFSGIPGRMLALFFAGWAVCAPFYASRIVHRTLNPGPVVWGVLERGVFENAIIPAPNLFVPMARASGDLPAGERILVVGDVKAAHIRSRALYQSLFDTPQLEQAVREARTADDLSRWFRQRRIGAVFFNPGGAVFLRSQFGHYKWSPGERAVLARFWQSRLFPVREMKDGGDLVMGLYKTGYRTSGNISIPLPGETR